jgi:hypothetical protein
MWVSYNEGMTGSLSFHSVDIAKYAYVNYPTFAKDEILKDFTVGMKKLNAPELVYLQKDREGETYYVPALRFIIEEERAIYKELVNF